MGRWVARPDRGLGLRRD
jgi:hypothetical protein